jgi:hypothetical protein
MYALFSQIVRFFPAFPPPSAQAGVARKLMESAEARAGSNPQQAQELREAAFAYLRVVR